jgi:hypothetical protein
MPGVKKEENVGISTDTTKLRIAEALAAATGGLAGLDILFISGISARCIKWHVLHTLERWELGFWQYDGFGLPV